MPHLRILYDVEGWSYHNQARALERFAPPDFRVTTAPLSSGVDSALGHEIPDLVYVLPPRSLRQVRTELARRGWNCRVVGRWSTDAHRLMGLLQELHRHAHAWIVCNRSCMATLGGLPGSYLIPDGVDLDVFRVQQPIASRSPRVLWTGSKLYRKLKGYDDLLVPLRRILRNRGIPVDLLLVDSFSGGKRGPVEMAEWYNRGTVLVCASSTEGTPNPALEAAGCGCTVVSTRVGNMPELIRDGINGFLVERDLDSLLHAVLRACRNHVPLAERMQCDIRPWHWSERSVEFFHVFREVLSLRQAPKVHRPDLSDEVTVFVTTIGAPSFELCMERLSQQDCTFRMEVIERVAPMAAAFQRMLDSCETTYFVQVDEDMLLFPHAVRTLHEALSGAGESVAMFVASLFDVHLGRCIQGVKIFRHAVARRYPLGRQDSFEVDQLRRMKRDGHGILRLAGGTTPEEGQALGLHGTHWTAASIFERYATLQRRRRRFPQEMGWFAPYPAKFLARFLEDPDTESFHALMGVVAGALAGDRREAPSKDFRRYPSQRGLGPLGRFVEQVAGPMGKVRPSSRRGSTLWCITTYFNPMGYESREKCHRIFQEGMRRQGVNLFTVELAFGDDPFRLPESPTTLRLRARSVLWQKERLINQAITRLPPECRHVAWIDGDILSGDDDWTARTESLLERHHVVQLFEKVVYLPPGHEHREIDFKPVRHSKSGHGIYRHGIAWQAGSYPDWIELRRAGKLPYATPGYGWAVRREVAESIGFYDRHILGSGDMAFAEAVLRAPGVNGWSQWTGDRLREHLLAWGRKVARAKLSVGFVPQTIYHLYHGRLQDRNYQSRLPILEECDFDPMTDITLVDGVFEWASDKPALHRALLDYFQSRNEDGA